MGNVLLVSVVLIIVYTSESNGQFLYFGGKSGVKEEYLEISTTSISSCSPSLLHYNPAQSVYLVRSNFVLASINSSKNYLNTYSSIYISDSFNTSIKFLSTYCCHSDDHCIIHFYCPPTDVTQTKMSYCNVVKNSHTSTTSALVVSRAVDLIITNTFFIKNSGLLFELRFGTNQLVDCFIDHRSTFTVFSFFNCTSFVTSNIILSNTYMETYTIAQYESYYCMVNEIPRAIEISQCIQMVPSPTSCEYSNKEASINLSSFMIIPFIHVIVNI